MKLKKDFGVTALLALIAVVGAIIAAAFLVFSKTSIELGMAFLSNIAFAAIGYYIGTKNQPPPTTSVTS